MTSLPVPRVVPTDVPTLERRAGELAAGAEAVADVAAAGLLPLVSFRLRGRPCAVETAVVARAVVLSRPLAVPLADGSERHIAFVLERPLRVADLSGAATGVSRSAAQLEGVPALVVTTVAGPVAVAVEGPIDLAEDRVSARSDDVGEIDAIRIAGRLSGGALLLDAGWLTTWAARVER